MSDLSSILGGVEGLAPEVITAIENLVKSREAELSKSLEDKYGVKPSVISDVETDIAQTVGPQDARPQDAVPIPPQDATPTTPGIPVGATSSDPNVVTLLARLASMEQQISQLKEQAANPEQVISSGGGDPVPHTLFLADGSIVKNHGGLATHYTTTETADDGTETENVQKVVAAYPA